MIADQVDHMKKDMENRMAQSNLTLEQYLQILGQTPEAFEAQLKNDSRKQISGYLVLEEVAVAENITVTDEELEVEFSKIAESYKMKIEDVKKALSNQIGEFKNNIKMNRVEDLLYKNND